MSIITQVRHAAVAVALAGALAAPALAVAASPDATISFHGGSAGFIAGISWGSGVLHYKGHNYPLKVGGLQVGTIGAHSFNAHGTVYHLHHLKDIEGTYGAGEASATVGVGAGYTSMQNGAGVLINAQSSSAGAKLTLGASGVSISLK